MTCRRVVPRAQERDERAGGLVGEAEDDTMLDALLCGVAAIRRGSKAAGDGRSIAARSPASSTRGSACARRSAAAGGGGRARRRPRPGRGTAAARARGPGRRTPPAATARRARSVGPLARDLDDAGDDRVRGQRPNIRGRVCWIWPGPGRPVSPSPGRSSSWGRRPRGTASRRRRRPEHQRHQRLPLVEPEPDAFENLRIRQAHAGDYLLPKVVNSTVGAPQ